MWRVYAVSYSNFRTFRRMVARSGKRISDVSRDSGEQIAYVTVGGR